MHRIALALGRTVAELNQTMSVQEFQQWRAFEAEEGLPLTLFRQFMELALPLFGNGFGGPAGGGSFTAADFISRPWQPATESANATASNETFEALAAMFSQRARA